MFTRSSRHYRGIMTSFYSICIVLGTVCVNPLSAVPEFTVSGHVGSTAVLPCELESEDAGTLYITWEIESETVFERHSEKTYQGEGYEGRVDVPEEELRKGNCSLVLRNLKPTDAAVYESYKIVRRTNKREVISRVNLSVDEKQNEERVAVNEVPREVWTGIVVGVAGTIGLIGGIGRIGLYLCKRRRNQNLTNTDSSQTNSPPNRQINPANTSQDENPNDQGEHLLSKTSQDDHDLLIPETDATTNQVLLTPESDDKDKQVLLTPQSDDKDNQVLLTPESDDKDKQILLTPQSADKDNQVLLMPQSDDKDNQVLLTPESDDKDKQVLLTPQFADTDNQVLLTPKSSDMDNQVLLKNESADMDNQVLLTPEYTEKDNQVLLTPKSADTARQVQPAKSMENNA